MITITTLTIDQLCVSPFNVRTNEEDNNRVEGIAKSIMTRIGQKQPGLMYPLYVHAMEGGLLGVAAGGRRYRAFKLLIERGQLPADWPIDVTVTDLSDAELTELSQMENKFRAPLRAYEEFEGFAAMHALGISVGDIAAHFSQSVRHIQQCLRLAHLAPEIFDAFKGDKLSLAQAKAYAATEDHAIQLHAWTQLEGRQDWQHTTAAIHAAMAIGDREEAKLLRFVTLDAYTAAGGGFELDLFADEAEHRGRVMDAGLLRSLADTMLAGIRDDARRRAGRDVKFESQPPRNEYRQIDHGLEIHPALSVLAPELEAELAGLQEEQEKLVEEARSHFDGEGNPLLGAQPAIDKIDERFNPNEARIAEIEAMRTILLPEGTVVATLSIAESGQPELRWWWASRKEMTGASKPARKAAVAAKPAPAPKHIEMGPLANGAAIGDWSYSARERAGQLLRAGTGLTMEGVDIVRSINRGNLAALLVADVEMGGCVGRDYFTWAQLRLLLTTDRGEQVGIERLHRADKDGEEATAQLAEAKAGALFEAAVEKLRSTPFITTADLAAAFELYLDADEQTKRLAGAVVAALSLERSLNAEGFRLPVHQALAAAAGGSDAAIREDLWSPTPAFLGLFSKKHQLDLGETLVDRPTLLSWSKMKSPELTAALQAAVGAVPGWVHPLLSLQPTAVTTLQEAAE